MGLIGVTGYGQAYYEGLSKLVEEGRSAWAAVTIINPEEAVEQVNYFKRLGVPIYADYREMLAKEKDNMDWVGIPTGIGWHRQMTVECLRNGLPVLVEKPLAATLQDVEMIQEAERETGLTVGVGFQHMYIDETWEIKRRLLEGEIGEIERMDCLCLWPRPQSYYHRNNWSGKLHDGQSWILDSPAHNGLSHFINLILFWGGREIGSYAKLERVGAEMYRAKPIESFDTVRTVGQLDSGVEASVILSHSSCHNHDPEIRIKGTKGSLVWRYCNHHTFYSPEGADSIKTPCHIRMREIMFEHMVDRFEGKPSRICTTEMATGAIHWVNAIHDTAPIHDIPEEYRQRIVDNEYEVLDTIRDLDYYTARAFHEKKSFQDLGIPWAVPMQERDVREYTAFEGHFYPDPTPAIPSPPILSVRA